MSGPARILRMRMRRLVSLALPFTLGATLSACFFYDSTWGQAKASQKRVAAQIMPSQLRGHGDGTALERSDTPRAPVQHLRLRAYATPRYAASEIDGRADFEQALNDANPTLAHDLSFRLELADYQVWPNGLADDDLSALLEAVKQDDPAQDVDWVIVLASPRHMVAVSADQLGVGLMLGRYLAIRAMSDADEFDVIEREFTELSESEKSKLYAARKRHKAATVLLHELGHTLGLPHELDQHSMMSPQYSRQADAFSSYAARLGQRVLSLRATTPHTELHRSAAQAALNVLHSAPPHTWEAGTLHDVEQLLEFHTRLGRAQPSANLPPSPSISPRAAAPSPAAGLAGPDRALFARAREAQAAGRVAEARTLAAPLFEAFPNDYAVQELRCQLAMKAGLSIDDESAECDPLRRLSGASF